MPASAHAEQEGIPASHRTLRRWHRAQAIRRRRAWDFLCRPALFEEAAPSIILSVIGRLCAWRRSLDSRRSHQFRRPNKSSVAVSDGKRYLLGEDGEESVISPRTDMPIKVRGSPDAAHAHEDTQSTAARSVHVGLRRCFHIVSAP